MISSLFSLWPAFLYCIIGSLLSTYAYRVGSYNDSKNSDILFIIVAFLWPFFLITLIYIAAYNIGDNV